MEIPATLSERFPFLDALEENWEPVSRASFYGWLGFYGLLVGNAAFGGHLFQWFDLVFIPIHEGGHLLFRIFGEWFMVAGGTFLQLFVPFALQPILPCGDKFPGLHSALSSSLNNLFPFPFTWPMRAPRNCRY